MRKRRFFTALRCAGTAVALLAGAQAALPTEVMFHRMRDGQIQPQAALAPDGKLHLIHFEGDPMAGDIFHTKTTFNAGNTWTRKIRVNSVPGSAIATGTIRGAHLALDGSGRPHVAWMGSSKATPRPKEGAPMLYTRINRSGTAFEPQRNLVTWATGLDGGGSLAADRKGNVYVAWHAGPDGPDAGEEARSVFVAHSTDRGKTFTRERRVSKKGTGACGCCGMQAFADKSGNLCLLYRTANGENRDMNLLISEDKGKHFSSTLLSKWAINKCPMSSADLSEARGRILATTERDGRVALSGINPQSMAVAAPMNPVVGKPAKHPVAVSNDKGEFLMAWIEGSGWNRGGKIAWQIYDAQGKPTAMKTRTYPSSPAWSLISAVALPNGDFLILF